MSSQKRPSTETQPNNFNFLLEKKEDGCFENQIPIFTKQIKKKRNKKCQPKTAVIHAIPFLFNCKYSILPLEMPQYLSKSDWLL